MSSRKIKHNGSQQKFSFNKNKKYKYNKSGGLEEVTATNVVGDDDIVLSGSKSSLRRMADMERNISILATKLTTTDGEASDTNDDDFDTVVNKDTKFKRDVQLGNGSSDDIRVEGHLHIESSLTLGSTAREAIQDAVVSPMLTGNTESGITVTYDDTGNEVDFTVTSAPKWATARTITLGGDASGSVSIDGTANKTLTVAVANDSHTHDTRYYTKAQVDAAIDADINAVVNAAPSTLNTLNELAAALGDDANFAATVNSSIAGKVAKTSSQALRATDAITVSNDTITIHKGDGTSESVTTTDANSNTYLTGASFATSTGVLTLTKNSGSVTVDLDGRFQPAGSYAASGTSIVAGNGLTGGGTLAATRTIHVGGGNGLTVTANGIAMSGSYTGSFTASGDVTAYSDESLKTNIQTIDGALGKVEAVRGVTFDRIADGSTSTGVVAQELLAVLPEAVHTDAEGVHSVAYGNITGLLIEAVKELSAEVKELKK
ncbi:tail fiber domain-containing protein [bacterium]|nr:tail fiber domain-containing protein [bacterium]